MGEHTRPRYRRYRMVETDLVKELVVSLAVVLTIVLLAAILFSSPDEPTLNAAAVARRDPTELLATMVHILDGENAVASYGPPYNNGSGSVQSLGPLSPQTWAGVTIPVDAARLFVLHPLATVAPFDPRLSQALRTFLRASPRRRAAWEASFQAALARARTERGRVALPPAADGPLPILGQAYLKLARTGSLEAIINASPRVYQTDFTRALLLLQGRPLESTAAAQHLLGNEWGMMKEPGNYPGAVWLWFYTLLYQIPPYNTSSAGDLLVGLTVAAVTIILALVPWIPGLRDLPRLVPVYRLIWKDYYAERKGRPEQHAPEP